MTFTLQQFFDQIHATLGDKTVGASRDIIDPCTTLLTIRVSVILTLAVIFFTFTFIVFLAVVATCFRGLFKTDSEDAEIGRRITAQANAHLCYMSGVPCGRGCPCERRRKLTMLSETKRRDWDTPDPPLCSLEKRSMPTSPINHYIPPALPFKLRLDAPPIARIRTRPALPANQSNPFAKYTRNAAGAPPQTPQNVTPLQPQVARTYAPPSYLQTMLNQPRAVRLPAMANDMDRFLNPHNSGYQRNSPAS